MSPSIEWIYLESGERVRASAIVEYSEKVDGNGGCFVGGCAGSSVLFLFEPRVSRPEIVFGSSVEEQHEAHKAFAEKQSERNAVVLGLLDFWPRRVLDLRFLAPLIREGKVTSCATAVRVVEDIESRRRYGPPVEERLGFKEARKQYEEAQQRREAACARAN